MDETTCPTTIASRVWRSRCFRVAAIVACIVAGFALATWADGPAHRILHPEERELYLSGDMLWLLRSVGYAPAWVLLAAIMLMVDYRRPGPDVPRPQRWVSRRGWLVLLTIAAAGVAAEILKVLIRRLRPPTWDPWDGVYVFRVWTDKPFSASGLGMPSSHAMIALAGMFLLSRMYPKAAAVFVALAGGCAFTRVATRGHFVSDVYVSAVCAWLLVWLLWRGLPGWRSRVEPSR